MKVLSVRQPWAWALIHGGKEIETRNWRTSYRGLLAIHAGKSFDLTADEFANMMQGVYGEPYGAMSRKYNAGQCDVRGAIIGTVELVGCIRPRMCGSSWKADGDDFYCWMLQNPKPLNEPIPMKGRLGLWDVPDDLFLKVAER